MNQYFAFAFENIINLAEVSLFFYFITRKLEMKRKHNIMLVIAPWILGLVIVINILKSLNISPIISMFSFLIFQIIFAFSHMEGTRAEKIVWACTFEILDVAADGMVFFTSSAIAKISMNELMYEYPQRYAVISAYILILAGFVLFFTKMKKQKFILPKKVLAVFLSATAIIVITMEAATALGVSLPDEEAMDMFYILYLTITVFLIFSISIILITIFTGKTSYENKMLSEKFEKLKRFAAQNDKKYRFKFNGSTYQVELKKIKYITSSLHTVKIVMQDGTEHEFYNTLDKVFKEIKEIHPAFERANKSFVVNMNFVDQIKSKTLITGNLEITISRKYSQVFKEYKIVLENTV